MGSEDRNIVCSDFFKIYCRQGPTRSSGIFFVHSRQVETVILMTNSGLKDKYDPSKVDSLNKKTG